MKQILLYWDEVPLDMLMQMTMELKRSGGSRICFVRAALWAGHVRKPTWWWDGPQRQLFVRDVNGDGRLDVIVNGG